MLESADTATAHAQDYAGYYPNQMLWLQSRVGEGLGRTIQFMREVMSSALVRARPARPGLTRSTVLRSAATVKVMHVPISSSRTDSHLAYQSTSAAAGMIFRVSRSNLSSKSHFEPG